MLNFWPFRSRPKPDAPKLERQRIFSTDMGGHDFGRRMLESFVSRLQMAAPRPIGVAMDDASGQSLKVLSGIPQSNIPEALIGWYASQSFIGYQLCAIIAQHWLIDKACSMPGRDAIRHGFDIMVTGGASPDADRELAEEVQEQNKYYRLAPNMEQFVKMGRVFGVRVAFFKIESLDPYYYEKPFNPDGITPGSYKGIVQVDPYWCIPVLDMEASSDPASIYFYEPTWWIINGKKYHRSHLCVFRNGDVPDMLKPMYQYGGISVPQQIMERVYGAERTANEAPQLAMSKRTMVWNTDVAAILGNQDNFSTHMSNWMMLRDNYGIKINDTDDTMQQFDTSLTDIDAVIMTQYQLVAAAARVPGTKLLGTTPKGFNSSGNYEESSYHEELETIQANDLTALVDRHHLLLARSMIEPENGLAPGSLKVNISWAPVDSPTALEYADINLKKAQTDALNVQSGAIDGEDIRGRLRTDPNSEYADISEEVPDDAMTTQELGPNAETPPTSSDAEDVGAAT